VVSGVGGLQLVAASGLAGQVKSSQVMSGDGDLQLVEAADLGGDGAGEVVVSNVELFEVDELAELRGDWSTARGSNARPVSRGAQRTRSSLSRGERTRSSRRWMGWKAVGGYWGR
jgi:hypothetical protein